MRQLEALNEATLLKRFDRLAALHAGPLCLGVSGGSDSLALAALLARWSKTSGRSVIGLCVDHGLQAGSDLIAQATVEKLGRLGLGSQILTWKPGLLSSGLQNKARAGRHLLLAEASKAHGSCLLLLAHTQDDQAETVLFRMIRGSGILGLSGMAELSICPQWATVPGIVLARPLLDVPRQALRDFLTNQSLDWHDDPANADLRFSRVQVRHFLSQAQNRPYTGQILGVAASAAKLRVTLQDWLINWMADHARFHPDHIVIDNALQGLPPPLAMRVLGVSAACLGGHAGLAHEAKLQSLFQRLKSAPQSLAGVRIAPSKSGLVLTHAAPRKHTANPIAPALWQPIGQRFAHLVADVSAVIGPTQQLTYDKTQENPHLTANHSFVHPVQGMVSAQ